MKPDLLDGRSKAEILDEWFFRVPEPLEELEEADEYTHLAETSFRESDLAFAHELAEKVPNESNAVDIGSGPAFQAIYLAQLRSDIAQIHLVDYSEEMLAMALRKGKELGIEGRLVPHFGDMTKLAELGLPPDLFVFSNTAIHELREGNDLINTMKGIGQLAGRNGIYLRDLTRPMNEIQAALWREEVLQGEVLPDRDLTLFRNSQRAGFRPQEVAAAISYTPLQVLGQEPRQLDAPKSRYWTYEVKPEV